MKTKLCATMALLATMVCCGPKAGISETRMVQLAPREADCKLEFIQQPFDYTLLQTWEVVGMISFTDRGVQDPMAEENRSLARPRACSMGGTAISLAGSGAGTNRAGNTTSSISYMVLHPKPVAAPAQPTQF